MAVLWLSSQGKPLEKVTFGLKLNVEKEPESYASPKENDSKRTARAKTPQ